MSRDTALQVHDYYTPHTTLQGHDYYTPHTTLQGHDYYTPHTTLQGHDYYTPYSTLQTVWPDSGPGQQVREPCCRVGPAASRYTLRSVHQRWQLRAGSVFCYLTHTGFALLVMYCTRKCVTVILEMRRGCFITLLVLDLRCWSCTVHTDVSLLYWR